jgi:hypothetical protein
MIQLWLYRLLIYWWIVPLLLVSGFIYSIVDVERPLISFEEAYDFIVWAWTPEIFPTGGE